MPYIQQVEEDQAEGLVAKVYQGGIERAGSDAKIMKIMSQHGPSLQASMQFYVAVMKAKNALSNRQKEMLATVVSNINDCYY